MSALRAARVGDHAKHGVLLEGRGGAGDEGTGSYTAGDSEEDHWWQAAEIIGISDRQMRRWRERYEEFGFDGLLERRRCRPSEKRVPLATAARVLGLYRDRYFDLNVRHFHEKLVEEHGISLSYSWVKAALQGAGFVARGRKRGVHRQRRARWPRPSGTMVGSVFPRKIAVY